MSMPTAELTTPVSHTVGRGALAGAAGGAVGAAALAWLVEPAIRTAIALEEASASPSDAGAHSHDHAHAAGEVVTRGEQVVFGLITVVVVGALVGIAFALVHRVLRHRLPGTSVTGTVMSLAALCYLTVNVAPAIFVPAGPPGVGDPHTVTERTATYLASIAGAVLVAVLVTTVARRRGLGALRAPAAAGTAVLGVAVLFLVLPDVSGQVPATMPADLLWHFRVASLAELGLMWLTIGATHAALEQHAAAARLGSRTRGSSVVTPVG